MRSWIACLFAGCAWSSTAHADQCAVLDDATAARAAEALRRHPEIVGFCEPCGELAPGPPRHAAAVASRRTADGVELEVDGRAIDLAYTYVQTSSHRYENLAALAACPTTGVSTRLAVDDASPTGVLIHADHADPGSPPPPGPSAPAPTIYLVAPAASSGVGWDAILAALGATTALAWLGAGRRRRRAMRPRATEL